MTAPTPEDAARPPEDGGAVRPPEDGSVFRPPEDGSVFRPPEDGYAGPAKLTVGPDQWEIEVELRGHFEPIDGQYHWYGRIASNDELAARLAGAKANAVLETKHGTSPCTLSDPDLWHRYRVTGRSTPPFPPQTNIHDA